MREKHFMDNGTVGELEELECQTQSFIDEEIKFQFWDEEPPTPNILIVDYARRTFEDSNGECWC